MWKQLSEIDFSRIIAGKYGQNTSETFVNLLRPSFLEDNNGCFTFYETLSKVAYSG